MNILGPKIKAIQTGPKNKMAIFLKMARNDFDYISIVSGDHLPK
jgi:hypothetical protein